MQRYSDTILDRFGNPADGVSVAVYVAGTDTPADLFSPSEDKLDPVSGISNPVVTGPDGVVAFAVANGRYRITYSGSSIGTKTINWLTMLDSYGSRFGTETSYSEFESDGSLLMVGDATIFDDLATSSLALQQQGTGVSNSATEVQTEFTTGANLSDYLYASVQMPHSWLIGSVIHPHIHWMQTTNAVPNWLMDYRWQPNGGTKVTGWTRVAVNHPVFTYSSGTLHNIANIVAGITPPEGAGLSDIVQFKIYRDNANTSGKFAGADPVNATAGITSFDIHVEKDRLGSRQEYIK